LLNFNFSFLAAAFSVVPMQSEYNIHSIT
jgi:hypothetical protein